MILLTRTSTSATLSSLKALALEAEVVTSKPSAADVAAAEVSA
jgi:hypothetical protein